MHCLHQPHCPDPAAVDRDAAQVVASFPLQGWSLLCNGVIMFEDTGELLPDGRTVPPQRGPAPHVTPAAHANPAAGIGPAPHASPAPA
jgi:hypothetical protein